MTPVTFFQRHTIFLLIGILISSTVLFRSEWFWALGWAGVWVYNLLIPVGFLLICCSICKLTGVKRRFGVLFLIASESTLLMMISGISAMQPSNFPKLHFIKNVYTGFHNTIQYDTSLSQYDPELGYLYKPGVNGFFENWEFGPNAYSTNQLGLRDDSASAHNPVIISLGDSFTTGWGVEQQETYADRLEKLTKVKVLNAGISSFGTVREGILLKKLPLDSCKLVIIQYCHNDLTENMEWSRNLLEGKRYEPTFGKKAFLIRQIQNKTDNIYVPFKYLFQVCKKAGMFIFLKPEQHDPFARQIAYSTDDHVFYFFQSLQSIRQYYKGNIVVISTSNSTRFDADFISKAKQYASDHRYYDSHFLDLVPFLRSKDNYLIDGHSTASGHQVIATQLYNLLITNQLLN